jgi:hypothetical protein
MTVKPGFRDVLWMATGAVLLLVLMLVVVHLRTEPNPAGQRALQARKLDLVAQMRLGLASASEAEKSSVMATNDEDSQTFADQARAATAQVEQQRKALAGLLATNSTPGETDFLAQFSNVFADFQHVDDELLALAVKNTNLKAYSLAFGPAADAIAEMDAALSRLVTKSADFPDARNVAVLALGAQTAALRIQALLPPHIAEESDQKMDELEARMAAQDQEVHKDLDGLAAIEKLRGDTDLETAVSSYARFSEIRARILVLSRENTNVRSLSISLDRKRKVMFLCQDALAALQHAIQQEQIVGPAASPR